MKKEIISALALAMALGTAVPAMAAEEGYETKEEATAAAEELIKESDINNGYDIAENNGKFYIQLKTDETKTETPIEKDDEQTEKEDEPTEKEDEPVENTFDPDKGYKTKEEAIKAAEEIVAKSEINKGYNVSQGADGLFYIQLTPQEEKTDGVERKPLETKVEAKVENKETHINKEAGRNAKTGITGIVTIGGVLAAATTAYTTTKRK